MAPITCDTAGAQLGSGYQDIQSAAYCAGIYMISSVNTLCNHPTDAQWRNVGVVTCAGCTPHLGADRAADLVGPNSLARLVRADCGTLVRR